LAFKDRVHMIDTHTPLAIFEDEFKEHKRDWLVERIKQQGADRLIYDQSKIAAPSCGEVAGMIITSRTTGIPRR
jgi:hypothetical protein